jgi:hypothetical protein
VEHGGDKETADVARREKGPPPGAMASDVEFDVVLVDGGNLRLQGGRAASPMVEFLSEDHGKKWVSVSPAERNWRSRG